MATVMHDTIKENATELIWNLCRPQEKTRSDQKKKRANKRQRYAKNDGKQQGNENEVIVERNPDELLRKLKLLCKTYPQEAPEIVCNILLKTHLVEGKTAIERERALKCIDELFQRSSRVRALICEALGSLLDAVFRTNVLSAKATEFRETATCILQGWNRKFGNRYPQLGIGLASEKISTEADISNPTSAETMRANVDNTQVENIRRGFRIFDGVPLSGVGNAEADLIALGVTKLNEIRGCLMILLPFVGEEENDVETEPVGTSIFAANASDSDDIQWEEEEKEESDEPDSSSRFELGAKRTEQGEAGVFHPYDQEQAQSSSKIYIPQDFSLHLTVDERNHDANLQDVRQALLDYRLTIERSVIPELRLWSDVLERVVTRNPELSLTHLLIRVKRLLSDLQTAVVRCERLAVRSRRTS